MGTSSFPGSEPSDSKSGDGIRPPDPGRWQRVESLFFEVLEAEPEDVGSFLAAREQDSQICRDVAELVLSEYRAEDFLEHSTQTYEVVDSSTAMPRSFGPYEVETEIGRGGMGVVFLAHDRRLGRQVAIKCLGGEGAPNSTERLEREARVLASLNHPNIATIFGLEPFPGGRALVLEYIAGQNLSDLLMAGPLSLRHALRICIQVASALAAAHDRGVIHRDLKPANIRLCDDSSSSSGPELRPSSGLGRSVGGRVKVLDFGLAKPVVGISDREVSEGITEEGKIVGTVSYMSPEQATGGAVDARTDIWAFGCVLFECLAGRRAFMDDGAWKTLQAVLHQSPPWDFLPSDLPPRLTRFLGRCLRKDPDDRLRSFHDARLALEDILAEVEGGDRRGVGFRLGPVFLRRIVAGLAAAAVLGGATGLGFWAGSAVKREPRSDGVDETPMLAASLPLERGVIWTGRGALAFSRDGRLVVFRSREGLVVRHLSTFEEKVLPGTFGAHEPFLSPNGKDVGFFIRDRLYRSPIEHPSLIPLAPDSLDGIGATWGDDGYIVLARTWSGGLWRVPEAGGSVEPLTRLKVDDREVSHRWPWALPGGRGVLYTVKTTLTRTFEDSSVAVFDAATGDQRHLLENATAPVFVEGTSQIFFTRDHAVYSVSLNLDTLALDGAPSKVLGPVAFDPSTGVPSVGASSQGHVLFLEPDARPISHKRLFWLDPAGSLDLVDGIEARNLGGWVRLSPSGRYAAVWVVEANNSIWVYDLERGTARMLTHGVGNCIYPVWHPDGKHVTYQVELQGGQLGLGMIRADGAGEPEILWTAQNFMVPSSWTPDGRYLLFAHGSGETDLDIWLWDSKEKHAAPFLQDHFEQREPQVSPDGRFVAYMSMETGQWEVFVRDFSNTGPSWQISRGETPSRVPFWSRDGRRLFFVQGETLWSVEVENGSSRDASLERFGRPKAVVSEDGNRIMEQGPDGRFIVLEQPEKPPSPQRLMLKTFTGAPPVESGS